MVKTKAIATNINEAINFPAMICQSVTALVINSSIVPDLFSSARVLMVIAGINKNKDQNAPNLKNTSRLA